MPDFTRRRLLGAAAGSLGVGAAASLLPPSVQRAIAAGPAKGGSLHDIEHVVLLMQENRSFDHYFGTLKGVRGFADPDALTLSTGKSVFYQPDEENPDGYLLPFHLDTHSTSAQAIPSTSHAWSVQHEAWNNGAMDKWLPAHRKADGKNGPYVMGYHTRADIPFQFALAEAFTICDNYFCSVFGPTWPNRLYWMTGTIDPTGGKGGPILDNTAPRPYRWTTYAERLQQAGVSWKVYQEEDDYGCNLLEQFQQFRDAKPGDPLHDRGMVVSPAGTFEEDARNDRLPTVSPWTVGGWAAGQAFDHTSVLQFLERLTGVEEPNISQWRRRTFGDLTSAFGFSHAAPKPPKLPDDTAEQLEQAKKDVENLPKPTLPGADQKPPRQERGHRPRR